MSAESRFTLPVHCPLCGCEVRSPIPVSRIDCYSSSYMQVVFGTVTVAHECDYGPDTDGLQPIERFVKVGALDDQGRAHR